jgi:ketosteroid isomerase-like protein
LARKPTDILRQLLANTLKPDVVRSLVASNATYVSLNFVNADLKRIMPYAGTHDGEGPEAIIYTFAVFSKIWQTKAFEVQHLFGHDKNVAAFGSFTYRSATLGKVVTSPFSVMAIVEDEKITYMQFMGDTFATASSFQMSGNARYHSDPDGEPFDIVGAPTIA